MPTADITYPNGQYAPEGGKVRLNVRYTGGAPNPEDVHIYVKDSDDSHFPSSPSAGWDIDPAGAANPGLTVNWPVGNSSGTYDFAIEWTWKTGDKRRERGGAGQYFVKAGKPVIENEYCWFLMAILMAIGGWVGAFAFGPSLIGYVIGLAAGFGLGVLICVLWHWANR